MRKTLAPISLPNLRALLLLTALILLWIAVLPSSGFPAQIKLAWDESPNPKVAGYRIYYSRVSGRYDRKNMVDVGRATTHVMQLDPGEWYFVVTAYDSQGNESNYSEQISWRSNGKSEKMNEGNSAQETRGETPKHNKLSPSRGLVAPGANEDSQDQKIPGQARGKISPSFEPKNLK
jgi:hypothetical protein